MPGDGAGPDDEFPGYGLARRGDLFFQFFEILQDCQCPRVKDIRLQGGHDGAAEPIKKLTFQP